jgi:hypothetical protein
MVYIKLCYFKRKDIKKVESFLCFWQNTLSKGLQKKAKSDKIDLRLKNSIELDFKIHFLGVKI